MFRWMVRDFRGKIYVSIMNFETFICVFPLGNPSYPAYMIALCLEVNKKDLYSAADRKTFTLLLI